MLKRHAHKTMPTFRSETEEQRFWETHDELKVLANKRDVPYQSLLKVFLAERIARETAVSAPTIIAAPRSSRSRRARSGR